MLILDNKNTDWDTEGVFGKVNKILKDNKKKLLTVPFGEDPVYLLSAYLQSDEGLDLYKFLENKFSEN